MKKLYQKTEQRKIPFFVFIVFGFLSITLYSCAGASDDVVLRAYQLRMDGQADSAKVLLEKCLKIDSTNAQAWFELARTKHHIGLGNPGQLFSGLDDLKYSIQKAVDLEPGNITFGYYNGSISFLLAYASMMRQLPDAKQKLEATFDTYKSLLKIKPDYKEAMLYLVEALSAPEEMGGNSTEALKYADQLMELDPVFGLKARELVLPNDANRIDFWKTALADHKDNADIEEQLGKAYLYQGEIEKGEQHLDLAMQKDPGKSVLLMDAAKFYLMQSRQDTALAKNALPKADRKISEFLLTDPIRPIRAFALNMQAGIRQMQGFADEAASLRTEANRLDPNVSKAFAVPGEILFSGPGEVSHYHSYFFRPF